MMVTAPSPIIGYDNASVISHYAIDHNLTLKQAAVDQGVSEELHDRWSTRSRRPKRLGGPGTSGEAGLSMTSDGAGSPDTTKHHDARPVGWMQSGRNRRPRKGRSAVAAKNNATSAQSRSHGRSAHPAAGPFRRRLRIDRAGPQTISPHPAIRQQFRVRRTGTSVCLRPERPREGGADRIAVLAVISAAVMRPVCARRLRAAVRPRVSARQRRRTHPPRRASRHRAGRA